MGILKGMWPDGPRASTSGLARPAEWLTSLFGGRSSFTGINVTEMKALQSTAVYACVHILAQTLAMLPLNVYSSLPAGGKARAPDILLNHLLHKAVNSEMSSFRWRETIQGHLGLWGNGYSEIEYNNAGQIIGLWPLRPDRTSPYREPETQELKYLTILPGGTTVKLPANRVLHIAGFGFDGIKGYNPIDLACQSIGLGLAAEEYGSRFFGNGATVGGVLEHPGELGKEGRENVRESFEEMHTGLSNAHRMMILEEGLQYKQIGIPPQTAQYLETRKFQITDIARFYHVPPHMIADLDRSTNNNIEHQSLEFVKHTMLPWLVRWEQDMDLKFFPKRAAGRAEAKEYFTKFNINGLLRGDSKSRSEFYHNARLDGWMNADMILELEDMNPIGGQAGQGFWMPENYHYADEPSRKDQNSSKGGE
ncbi:MAG: phage portal protein [Bacillota bacterium]